MKYTKFSLTVPVERHSDPGFLEEYFEHLIQSGFTIREALSDIVQFQIFEYHMERFYPEYGDRNITYMR